MGDPVLIREGYAGMLLALAESLVAYIHLYTNDPIIHESLTAVEMEEPDYIGYEAQPVVRWTPPHLIAGVAKTWADPLYYIWTEGPDPPPIRGCYFTHGPAGPMWMCWRRGGEPYRLGAANPILTVQVSLALPLAGTLHAGAGATATRRVAREKPHGEHGDSGAWIPGQ